MNQFNWWGGREFSGKDIKSGFVLLNIKLYANYSKNRKDLVAVECMQN